MLANIIRNRKKTAIGGGGGGIVIDNGDPFYSAVSMLLPMDGTNGSTTFTDSGPNAIALTAVGNTQVSTTQSKFGGASAYFDGSGDHLSFPTSDKFNFGSGDFTVEFWYYYNGTPEAAARLFQSRSGDVYAGLSITHKFTNIGTGLAFGSSMNGSSWTYNSGETSTIAVTANAWTHVAVVRSGTVLYCYINGVQNTVFASFVGSLYYNAADVCVIGGQAGTSRSINGFIDDLRISRFARYTSTFTPPTAALPTTASSTPADPYYGYTSLLLHMDGSSGSTNFVDSGPSARTITAVGNAQISTAQSKFGGASAYFDGTGDYLSFTGGMPSGSGTAFTIECWIRLDDLSDYRSITRTVGGLHIGVTATGQIICDRSGFGTIASSAAGVITAETWYHIAVTRDTSNAYKVYVNGTQVASGTNSFSVTAATTIGFSAFSGAHYFKGYIDDFRATNVLRYTSAFAPPAQAHLEYANGNDRHFSNVSLLLHMDGANGSTTFTDSSLNALAVTAAGNAQISTSSPQYGTGSATFDGATNTALSLDGSTGKYAFGTSPFTVEFWIYPTNLTARQGVYSNNLNSSSGSGTGPVFAIRGLGTTGVLGVGNVGASDTVQTGSNAISANVWQHVALVREGTGTNQSKIYVNGLLAATGTISDNFSTSRNAAIGRTIFYSEYFTGKIDDVRITKGVARYTSNFTPPTAEFPNA